MTREELKQADTKKLISALQYCGRDSYYATYYDEVVDEITQRLNRIAELKAQLQKKINITTVSDYPYSALKLEEAKEIIKRFVTWADSYHPKEYFDCVLKDAKKFLKEIEK